MDVNNMEDSASQSSDVRDMERDFQKLSETIALSIKKTAQNVSTKERMVNQIGTAQDSPELRTELHCIQRYTQQLVKDTNGYLKQLRGLTPPTHSPTYRQCKMQRERLQEDYTMVLNKFQMVQREAVDKEKKQVNKVKAQTYGDPFRGGSRKDQQLIELQPNFNAQHQLQLQDDSEIKELQEQEHSIRQLERDIDDVNQIFKELGALVHEQGETVDSIEASVERATDFVGHGTHQLYEASTYKNKIRKKKLFFALIASIVLAAIIIIIVVETRN